MSPGPIAGILTVETGPREVPTAVTLWVHTLGERGHSRVHSEVSSSTGGILSASSPSGNAPILPTLHNRSETQLRNRFWGSSPTTREQTWQGNHGAKGRLHSTSGRGSDHNISQTPCQGDSTSLSTNFTHQGADARNSNNYEPADCRKKTTNTVSLTKWDDKEIRCRQRSKIKTYN